MRADLIPTVSNPNSFKHAVVIVQTSASPVVEIERAANNSTHSERGRRDQPFAFSLFKNGAEMSGGQRFGGGKLRFERGARFR